MTATPLQSNSNPRLNNGDPFPVIHAQKVGGGMLNLPADLNGSWSVVLFYRGHWCPFCRTQLSDFQKHLDQYDAAEIKVVALSVDTEEHAEQTVSRHHLSFPVGYGLDPQSTAATVGTSLSDGSDGLHIYLQATGFVLTPGGEVALAVYSTGAVGRLSAVDTLGFVNYVRRQ